MADHETANLTPADRVMLDFAVKLTLHPQQMRETDLGPLRENGFDDAAIHDIAQVVALFNYYNRMADGLGIDLEDDFPPVPDRA